MIIRLFNRKDRLLTDAGYVDPAFGLGGLVLDVSCDRALLVPWPSSGAPAGVDSARHRRATENARWNQQIPRHQPRRTNQDPEGAAMTHRSLFADIDRRKKKARQAYSYRHGPWSWPRLSEVEPRKRSINWLREEDPSLSGSSRRCLPQRQLQLPVTLKLCFSQHR
jgi:hypothetical protein